MKLLLHLLVVLLTAAPIGAVPLKDRDLPWGFLVSELSPTAGFVDETSNQNYIDQCSPEFLKQWLVPPNASTNLNLIAQPGTFIILDIVSFGVYSFSSSKFSSSPIRLLIQTGCA